MEQKPKLFSRLIDWFFNRKETSTSQKISLTVVGDNNRIEITIKDNDKD